MQLEVVKYSEEFKRVVVSMLESGELKSMEQARRLFNIKGSSIVSRWIKKLGKQEILPTMKVRRIEDIKESDPILYERIIKHIQ